MAFISNCKLDHPCPECGEKKLALHGVEVFPSVDSSGSSGSDLVVNLEVSTQGASIACGMCGWKQRMNP